MKKPVQFTPRELDIMSVLWEQGPCTVAQVREKVPADLAHNTVLTWLTILENKGYVAHTKVGRSFTFHARVAHDRAGVVMLNRIIDKIFGGSVEQVVKHLIAHRELTREELVNLKAAITDELKLRI